MAERNYTFDIWGDATYEDRLPDGDAVKFRRHHNNDGRRQIKNGSTRKFVERLARSLGVPVRGSANTGPVAGREQPVRANQRAGAAYPAGGSRTPVSTRVTEPQSGDGNG